MPAPLPRGLASGTSCPVDDTVPDKIRILVEQGFVALLSESTGRTHRCG